MSAAIETFSEYQEASMRTAKKMGSYKLDLTHAALGLSSEVGEFVTSIKAHVIYGKPLDTDNCIEELGDLLWFISLAATALGYSMETVAERNIQKLKLRYPEKYSDEAAIERADKTAGNVNELSEEYKLGLEDTKIQEQLYGKFNKGKESQNDT